MAGMLVGALVAYMLLASSIHFMGWCTLSSIGKINFVFVAILMFVGGIIAGKKTSKKGYLEGLKLGGITAAILFLLNIIFTRHIDLYVVLYYIVIVTSSLIGSMVGINLRH